MFTIRVDKSIVDFYDDLAQKTNRSRNELIGLALEYAKDKIKIEPYSVLTKYTPNKKAASGFCTVCGLVLRLLLG